MKYIIPEGVVIFRYGMEQFSNMWKLFKTTRRASFSSLDIVNPRTLTDISVFCDAMNVPNFDKFTFFQLPPEAHPWVYIAVPTNQIISA